MVFPRFSHETSCDFRGFASVLHAALETCAGPAVLALVQRLERESCERCEASEKVGTGGGMEVKLGNIQLWLLLLLLFLLLLLLLLLLFIVITIFSLLIKAKLSGWGSFLMAQKWWISGYWCFLQHATWIRLPSFSLATRVILLDQGDPVDTFASASSEVHGMFTSFACWIPAWCMLKRCTNLIAFNCLRHHQHHDHHIAWISASSFPPKNVGLSGFCWFLIIFHL